MTNKYKNKISSNIKIYKKLLNEKNLLKIEFLVKKILETFKNKKKNHFLWKWWKCSPRAAYGCRVCK